MRRAKPEPSFEEFLAQPEPQEEPQMPTIRPSKIQCYVNRDEQYYRTLEILVSGLVVLPPDSCKDDMSLDKAAAIIATSHKVTSNQMQVARLSQERFLVLLPPMMNRDEVVAAIPKAVWDEGYRFQQYSPLNDASISIPFFKLWVDIKGVPLELHTKAHMARAVSSFGVYLGSIEPANIGDCQTWSIFIATDDLANVPHQIEFKVGGTVHMTQVVPRKWIKGQVLKRADLPPTTVPYQPPSSSTQQTQSDTPPAPYANPGWLPDDDVIPMSLSALREIFRCTLPSELPPDFAACLAGDRRALEANHSAYRIWAEQSERERLFNRNQSMEVTPENATPDQPLPSLRPVQSTRLAPAPSQPAEQPTTVHRMTGQNCPTDSTSC